MWNKTPDSTKNIKTTKGFHETPNTTDAMA